MSSSKDLTTLSKFLSYVLRHHPEDIGLELDENGWVQITELIKKAQKHGKSLSRNTLEQIMQHGSKQRFIISGDGSHIRAGITARLKRMCNRFSLTEFIPAAVTLYIFPPVEVKQSL